MNIRVFGGAVAVALGLLIALGPQFLFKVCEPMEDNFMKCHWTAPGGDRRRRVNRRVRRCSFDFFRFHDTTGIGRQRISIGYFSLA
jgi:hypothetical protein